LDVGNRDGEEVDAVATGEGEGVRFPPPEVQALRRSRMFDLGAGEVPGMAGLSVWEEAGGNE
jgi:hypothetical protein